MSFNRNSTIPNKFKSFDIDTSNWPARHRFIANLPDNPDEFTENNWLNLIVPNQESGGSQEAIEKAFNDFLSIRRRLEQLNLLADYNATSTQVEMEQTVNNLKNNDDVTPYVAVLLGKSYKQMEADTHALGVAGPQTANRIGLGDNVDQLVAFFNTMMCCLSESVSKEGKSYSQADGYFGPTAIANNLWPIFTGDNEMKEFKLYLLIKKFYFDSKLYKFISPIHEFSTMEYRGTTINAGTPIYETNKLAPNHIYRLFLLHLWLKNKKATRYNALSKINKIGFCQSFFEAMKGEIIATQYGSLGNTGSIKTLLANYLVNRDPIYLYSAVLSSFTNPANIFPSFDEMHRHQLFMTSAPDFIGPLFMVIAEWKRNNIARIGGLRGNLDFNYVDKLYKSLSKLVSHKNKKISKFTKTILLLKKNVVPVVDLKTKTVNKLNNMNPIIFINNNSLIKTVGFYINPIKSGYAKNAAPDKIYLGGRKKKYTLKNRKKNKRKTLKLQ